jgi:hypothetical protein
MPWTVITDIVIHPLNPQILFASDQRLGVYMSTNGGETWLAINEGLSTKAVSALAISSDGRVLYATTVGERVFRLDLLKSSSISLQLLTTSLILGQSIGVFRKFGSCL